MIRDHYLCQICLRKEKLTSANTVHHIKPLETHPELALETDNLESICPACHNKEHTEKGAGKKHEPNRQRRAAVVKEKANQQRW
ncbi:HNH endonuclease signature motif containing protein [Paenibacillus sp. D9]|uniref:HNH endonuclease signature motif containing protein n=1 Tax=Paenibacillus sp. D9 TaxID=665792 RepID=UPI001E5E06FC|nr:HNH endonuclease signature motif containing protein [Paenibacillus sp. D9]